jgi:4-hydroxy-tetrahydrodipicolinate reductase
LGDILGEAAQREVGITSIRTGHVPGRHEVWIDGPHEQVVLTHEARNRRVFADGAVSAAAWLRGRKGIFTMDDVIGLEGL